MHPSDREKLSQGKTLSFKSLFEGTHFDYYFFACNAQQYIAIYRDGKLGGVMRARTREHNSWPTAETYEFHYQCLMREAGN